MNKIALYILAFLFVMQPVYAWEWPSFSIPVRCMVTFCASALVGGIMYWLKAKKSIDIVDNPVDISAPHQLLRNKGIRLKKKTFNQIQEKLVDKSILRDYHVDNISTYDLADLSDMLPDNEERLTRLCKEVDEYVQSVSIFDQYGEKGILIPSQRAYCDDVLRLYNKGEILQSLLNDISS